MVNAGHNLPEESCWFGISLGSEKFKVAFRCLVVLARPLHNEHRLKNTQQLINRSLRQTPQSLDETVPIYSPQLISQNMTDFAI